MRATLRTVPSPLLTIIVTLLAVTLVKITAACAPAGAGVPVAARSLAAHDARRARPPEREVQLIPLEHARAKEVASALLGVGQGRGPNRTLFLTGPVRIQGYHSGNALLVLANAEDQATLRALVKRLDRPRRIVRLHVSLVEGSLAPETVHDVPMDRGGRPTGRTLLRGQRVLSTGSLLLGEREERVFELPREVWERLGCLWGAGRPRLALSARFGWRGEVEVSLRRQEAGNDTGDQGAGGGRTSASVAIAVDPRRSAALAFVPSGESAGLGPSLRLVHPEATGFVVPARCGDAQSVTRILVITPTILDI